MEKTVEERLMRDMELWNALNVMEDGRIVKPTEVVRTESGMYHITLRYEDGSYLVFDTPGIKVNPEDAPEGAGHAQA